MLEILRRLTWIELVCTLHDLSSYQLLPRSSSALVAVWQRTGGAGASPRTRRNGPFRAGPQIQAGRSAGQAHTVRGREVY